MGFADDIVSPAPFPEFQGLGIHISIPEQLGRRLDAKSSQRAFSSEIQLVPSHCCLPGPPEEAGSYEAPSQRYAWVAGAEENLREGVETFDVGTGLEMG